VLDLKRRWPLKLYVGSRLLQICSLSLGFMVIKSGNGEANCPVPFGRLFRPFCEVFMVQRFVFIQTASGTGIGVGIFPLNRFGYFLKAASRVLDL